MHRIPRQFALLLAGLVITLMTTLTLLYSTQTGHEPTHAGDVTATKKSGLGIPAFALTSSPTAVTAQVAQKPEADMPIPTKKSPHTDWQKYPGTLAEQIQRALDQANGEMAADLAQKLFECEHVKRSLAPENYQHIFATTKNIPDDIRKAVAQNYQRINSYCQTVTGDFQKLRQSLLDVAIKENVVGAALQSFYLGVRRPEVLQSILRDAQAGDLQTVNLVATAEPENLGIDSSRQAIFRYAMVLAAQESEPRSHVRLALSLAESAVASLRGEKTHQFDSHGLDESARNQAQAIAAQISIRQREFE